MVESAAVARPGQPKLHELAKLWDAHAVVREQVRATGKLLLWPSAKQTGVISKASLSTNRHVILAIVDVWSSTCKTPKAPNIPWLRQEVLSSETPRIMCCSSTDLIHYPIMRHGVLHPVEVEEIHRLLTPVVDKVNVYVDQWGCKRLCTWAIRRFRCGQTKFRDQQCKRFLVPCLCSCRFLPSSETALRFAGSAAPAHHGCHAGKMGRS